MMTDYNEFLRFCSRSSGGNAFSTRVVTLYSEPLAMQGGKFIVDCSRSPVAERRSIPRRGGLGVGVEPRL